MAHSYRLGLVAWRYQIRISVGPDICHRGCIYTVLQTVQRPGVYSAVYGTVHYKEPLESFEIKVGHSLGFGLPSVAILPWLCRKRRKAIFISYDVVSAGWRSMSIHNLVWFNHFNSYNTEIFVYVPWRSLKSQLCPLHWILMLRVYGHFIFSNSNSYFLIVIVILSVRGPSLDVNIWSLESSYLIIYPREWWVPVTSALHGAVLSRTPL